MDNMNNLSSFIQSRQQQSRLDDIQQQIQGELDLMPVRESDVQYHDPFAMAQPKKPKKKKKGDSKKEEKKQEEEPQQNSLLNDEMFMDAEQKRDMYLKMFVQQPPPPDCVNLIVPESNRTGTVDGDFNERASVEEGDEQLAMTRGTQKPREGQSSGISDYNYSNTMKSTKFYNRSLLPTNNASQLANQNKTGGGILQKPDNTGQLQEMNYDLTQASKNQYQTMNKSSKSGKSVSFKQPQREEHKFPLRQGSGSTVADNKLSQLHQALSEIHEQNQQANKILTDQITCDNPKILAPLMEHIVLHWDDVVDLLMDELVHEEVQEMNRIEWQRTDHRDSREAQRQLQSTSTTLADRSMYGKYHDYKTSDLRDIMALFDDYMSIEQSVLTKANILS